MAILHINDKYIKGKTIKSLAKYIIKHYSFIIRLLYPTISFQCSLTFGNAVSHTIFLG